MDMPKQVRCPTRLKGEAREFWADNWNKLVKEGHVDPERDVFGFSLLCEIWRVLMNTDPIADNAQALRYGSMLKRFQEFGKQYGLFPKDRKQAGFDQPANIADVIKKLVVNE